MSVLTWSLDRIVGLGALKGQAALEPAMKVASSVAEVLNEHVTLEVECIDRLYLNLYIPILQCERGVGHFWINHRGHRFATSSLMAPMTKAFVSSIERFAEDEGFPLIKFSKGERKEEVAKARLADFPLDEGILLIGKAQEKAKLCRTVRRRNPRTGGTFPWLVRTTAIVYM